jgi:hypothetical protein
MSITIMSMMPPAAAARHMFITTTRTADAATDRSMSRK